MKLTGIQLKEFRIFRTGLEVRGLEPGLTIFHGPNESGKSTLAHAIRSAFFERHNTGTLSDLQPWGETTAAPEVMLTFEFDGREHRLSKRFMRQRRCTLDIGGELLDGDEAEQYLAQLMGFTQPGRGGSRPEHWGVPGLLWIEQGSGHQLQTSVQHAHDHLQGVLSDAMGHVASSDGDRVLQSVSARLDELLTRNGAPRKAYRQAIAEQQRLDDELEALDARIRTYRHDVDELSALKVQHDTDATEQPWHALRIKEQEARKQLDDVERMRSEQKRQRDALDVCQHTQKLLHQQLQTFDQQEENVRARERELIRKRERHQTLTSQAAGLRQALDTASAVYTNARVALVRSREAQLRQDKKIRILHLQDELNRLRASHQQASQIQVELDADTKRADAVRIDPEALKQLRQLHEQLQSVEIRQQAVATRLQFDLEEGRSVTLGDTPVSGQAERLLLDTTVLHIPDIGRVHIRPGGDDVSSLARDHARLTGDWAARIQALGVTSLEQALQRATDHAEVMARIRHNESLLALHAPDGLAVLERRLNELSEQLQSVQRDYDALPPASQDDVDDLSVAQIAEQQAEWDLETRQERIQEHQLATATAQAELEAAQREYQQAKDIFEDVDRTASREQALRRLNEERARESALNENITSMQVMIDAVAPDILEQDIRRYGQSAARAQEAHAERERSMRELKGRLQALGAEGLEEQRNDLAGQRAVISRRVDEFSRNAAALGLLHQLLRDKRQALTRELHAPLKRRLIHYLNVLFQTSEGVDVTLGEDLMPVTLTRDRSRADLQALSFGAREQMGLISRLAYADLLKEAGQPTLLMLDDALVHSDDTRLTHMKRILFDAGVRHQILLFTCHPEKWRDMGVTPRAIRDLVM